MPRTATLEVGQLRADVDLQRPSGTSSDGYETVATRVPAQIRTASGNELLRYGAQVSVNAMVITMRYRQDVRADMRISYPSEGRYFQVTSYGDEAGDKKWLTVYASELLQ